MTSAERRLENGTEIIFKAKGARMKLRNASEEMVMPSAGKLMDR